MAVNNSSVLALDVGERRIGVAIASQAARLPRVLETINRSTTNATDRLRELVAEHEVSQLVVGLPRGLDGQDTAQTDIARHFAAEIEQELGVTVTLQDEAATSLQAEAELKQRGKPYDKADIDGLSAVYILQDWLAVGERP